MIKLVVLATLLCLGCSGPQDPQPSSPPPAAIEVVKPGGDLAVGVSWGPDGGLIFYPAETGGEPWTPPPSDERGEALARRFGPEVRDALQDLRTSARSNAPPVQGRFPLVIFQPGAGLGAVEYRLLLEDLASRGYVVLALNPLASPQASRARYDQAAREMLDALAAARTGADPRLAAADPSRAIFVGHSIGGAAALIASAQVEDGIAINLDGDLPDAKAVSGPTLYLIGHNPSENERSRTRRSAAWRDSVSTSDDAVALQVMAMGHFDFADIALAKASVSPSRRAGRVGSIDGRAAQALTADLVAAFLDSRVKGVEAAWPEALARQPAAQPPTAW